MSTALHSVSCLSGSPSCPLWSSRSQAAGCSREVGCGSHSIPPALRILGHCLWELMCESGEGQGNEAMGGGCWGLRGLGELCFLQAGCEYQVLCQLGAGPAQATEDEASEHLHLNPGPASSQRASLCPGCLHFGLCEGRTDPQSQGSASRAKGGGARARLAWGSVTS